MILMTEKNKYTQRQIDQVKKDIRLLDLAFANGYKLLERGRWPKIISPLGHVIITHTEQAGGDSYFDDGERGDVIKFYRNHIQPGASFKEAMEYLASITGVHIATEVTRKLKVKSKLTVEQATATWNSFSAYKASYLNVERKLSLGTLGAFSDYIRQNSYKSACFAHRRKFGEPGVTGWEIKSWKYHGFLNGGERFLFMARPAREIGEPTSMVVCEGAIDCMSYYEMHHRAGTLYVSTGGSIREAVQVPMLAELAGKWFIPVIAAFDNDRAGDKMTTKLAKEIPSSLFMRRRPRLKDWNDVLKAKKAGRTT